MSSFYSFVFVFIVVFLSPSSQVTPEDTLSIMDCAERGLLFFPSYQGCHLPLSPGPCGENEMIVLGSEGMGECVRNPCSEDQLWTGEQCVEMYGQEGCNGRGEMRLYNVTGGIECKCEDGWGRLGGEGVCYQHSTQGPCKQGEMVLQPEKEKYCEEDAGCVHHRSCPSFMSDLAVLGQYKNQPQMYQSGVARLSAQVCSKRLLHVCCKMKQTLTDPLQQREILSQLARQHRPLFSCSSSPCTFSTVPWPDRQGCYPLSGPTPPDCILEIIKEEQQEVVKCEKEIFDITIRNVPMAYSHKCSKGRIWSRFRSRCVKNFFG